YGLPDDCQAAATTMAQCPLGADDGHHALQPFLGAVIGIYTGREDNIFWRRLPDGSGKVEAAGAQALCERDAAPLGREIIHSVTNPIPRLTGAIHVYGGDFFDPTHRSEWDPETLLEGPFDPERAVRRFEEANAVSG
ncbi:MAG: hypothetical protein WBZ35_20410, partial [Pseudolabrys sp.]